MSTCQPASAEGCFKVPTRTKRGPDPMTHSPQEPSMVSRFEWQSRSYYHLKMVKDTERIGDTAAGSRSSILSLAHIP